MALDGTYTGLKASIASWMHRDDMTALIPDFVLLAEARISRDLRLRRQITTTTLSTVAATQAVTLPSDWLELENLSLATAIERNLTYMNNESLNVRYPDGSGSGEPRVYTLEADTILLGPTPDAVYTLNILYYARWAALSTTATNWLLTYHPNIYLFAALTEASDWAKDAEGMKKWDDKYRFATQQLQDADYKAMFSGSALRVRNI